MDISIRSFHLQYYGITEERYYTVMFGVSRALGVLAQVGALHSRSGYRWLLMLT